ncbi:MAG: hypothetical protein GY841_07230 [FCB group bacterium]|nr:hypothetical protein [FCB group bacterium]
MKDVKFRIWHKLHRRMYQVTEIDFYMGNVGFSDDFEDGSVDSVDFDDCVLMQYTGAKDKNGIEICEGDIIKIEQREDRYMQVKYIDYAWISESVKEPFKLVNIVKYGGAVVVGNIYENPELLEKD